MKKRVLLALGAAALILTGCEVSKEEVMQKKYVLIAQHVSSMGCSFLTMGYIVDEYGLVGSNYHEDSNVNATCEDYGKVKDDTCGITVLKPGSSGYGSSACAIGADALNGGQDENATKQKHYLFIVKNVRSDGCGKIVIEPIAKENGYNDVKFYEDKNADCNDFNAASYECKEKVLVEGDKGYGDSTCVVGTDTPPH